jgi:hypothetical protein
MAIWLRGLERWYLVLGGVAVGRGFEPQSDLGYLVLGGVAVGRGFEPQSDLELSFAKILIHKCNKQITLKSFLLADF